LSVPAKERIKKPHGYSKISVQFFDPCVPLLVAACPSWDFDLPHQKHFFGDHLSNAIRSYAFGFVIAGSGS
jgi:hypothetical protein